MKCTGEHEAIKADPMRWERETEALPNVPASESYIDDGVEVLALRNCVECGSTLGRAVGLSVKKLRVA